MRNRADQDFRDRWCPVTAADRVIRLTTAGAVVGVAVVAAVASYEHAYALVRAHGEAGWTARLVPLTVDGLIYASSMVMLDAARRQALVPALARWLLGLGITATQAANVAHGLGRASDSRDAEPTLRGRGSLSGTRDKAQEPSSPKRSD
jgi:hypothetical protein